MKTALIRSALGLAAVAASLGATSGTPAEASGVIQITATNVWAVNGGGDELLGTFYQYYSPRAAWAQWVLNADWGEQGSLWTENGPNTHTLESTTFNSQTNGASTASYPIDWLGYPKTVDAAIHIWYTGADGQACDLWVAGPSHDYSTGGTYGGQTDVYC